MFKVVLTLDCQINQLPREADQNIREVWADNEFGNNSNYYSWDWDEDIRNYPALAEFLEKQLEKEGLDKSYELLLHWWW